MLGSALLAGRRAASPTGTAVRRWMSGTSSARRAIPVLVEVVRRCEPWRQRRGQPVGERGEEPSYGEDVSGGGRRLDSQQSSERGDERARTPELSAETELCGTHWQHDAEADRRCIAPGRYGQHTSQT